MPQYKRRKYFINKEIQLKYILLTISLLALYTLIMLAAVFGPYILVMITDSSLKQKAVASQVLLLMHGSVWPGIACVIILFGIYSIFITHKIVGPLFVIDRVTKKITDGDLSVRAHIRKTDDLHDFKDNFNLMADHMEGLLVDLDREYRHLSKYISELEYQIMTKNDVSREFLENLSDKMNIDKNNIGNILKEYKYRRESDV